MVRKNFIYFVEGECEMVLVRTLINHFNILPPGKIRILNICQKAFPESILFSLRPGTCVVLIFDTDAGSPRQALETVKRIISSTTQVELIVVPQCRNLEDELVRACRNIKEIRGLTRSRSNKNFKHDFIQASNVGSLLSDCGFDFSRLWSHSVSDEWEQLRRGDLRTLCTKKPR